MTRRQILDHSHVDYSLNVSNRFKDGIDEMKLLGLHENIVTIKCGDLNLRLKRKQASSF